MKKSVMTAQKMSINIGSRLEPFFDNALLDTEKTTAAQLLHHPVRREPVLLADAPWDGDGMTYFNIVRFGDTYRMYYNNPNSWFYAPTKETYISGIGVLESPDGINWTRPDLGIVTANGNTHNNMVLVPEMLPERYTGDVIFIDNFFVFEDTNPNKTVPYRYKALTSGQVNDGSHGAVLYSYGSDDGLHFTFIGTVTEKGAFDTLNTVHYNAEKGCYFAYIREYHERIDKTPIDNYDALIDDRVRDICVITSPDFLHWSDPVRLDYGDVEEFPMYTNNVIPYYRAPHILVGMPTRYVERKAWCPNFDRLCGKENRLRRTQCDRREGTTVTDCLFMTSRDGYHFKRYDEAFLPPDPENGINWVYGDMYPAYGFIETPSAVPGADNELSIYLPEGHCNGVPNPILRYTIRIDGFVSMHADKARKAVVTKPFIFDGDTMLLNFSTSARGYIYITLKDVISGEEIKSYEVFGNKVDRIIDFDGDLSAFAGKEVVMTIEMSDADVYSFRFTKE